MKKILQLFSIFSLLFVSSNALIADWSDDIDYPDSTTMNDESIYEFDNNIYYEEDEI